MYNAWNGATLGWTLPPNCTSWNGIVCNNAGNVISMFVKFIKK